MGVSRNLANKQHIMAIVRGSMMIGQWVLHRSKYESLEGHRIVWGYTCSSAALSIGGANWEPQRPWLPSQNVLKLIVNFPLLFLGSITHCDWIYHTHTHAHTHTHIYIYIYYYIILYYILLYSILLYYIILYYIILYCIILYYSILYYIIVQYSIIHIHNIYVYIYICIYLWWFVDLGARGYNMLQP